MMMDIQKIIECLPHRYPFLLVDRVLSFEVGKKLSAIKNVTINEPFFMGHFPTKAIMPGVLLIESLAQAAAILAYCSLENSNQHNTLFYLGALENTRFKKIVVPGDQLLLNVEIVAHRKSIWKFIGQIMVDGQLACSTEVTCAEGKV
ncbi:MAG: 3-hydroxyacyl-ACP dehydratase FabZ [Gammaproteobacteria bacterium]|jgi:3-hydroxyacyl-[acyl-carrier-protein] dehydratase